MIPEGFDKVLWGDLIVMFNPDEQDEFWNSQHEWKVVSWKLHSSSGVHTLMTDEGLVVHMLIEKKYPLKKEIVMQMLKHKNWLVQDQTVLGKDYSNLLIADSLLKTIWFINAPCYDNEALASLNTNGIITKRVKISSTNVRLETTVPQKEETFQVVIDLVKNSSCFKAFTIYADVLEIFMQQFWMILDICPRVEGVNFSDAPDDDTTLAFLIKLGYKGEDYQEYRLSILKTILTETIKQSKSYQMFIKYSTGRILPNKSRGKGSQRKKTTDDSQETIDVSEESEPKPESVKRKTSGNSISQTKVEEVEGARQVHATHARIVTKSVPESTKKKSGGRSSKSVVIQDTLSTPNSKPATLMAKLKGTRGSNEGTSTIPGVPNESTIIFATSSVGTGTKPGVPDEEKDITENIILEWGSEQESEYSKEDKLGDEEKDDKDDSADDEGNDYVRDDQDADDEDAETKFNEDDIYKYNIRMRKDEDEEMLNAKVDDYDKGDEEVTDAAKVDAEKTSEVKDDAKKTELPPSSSSLSVSLGFGDQFLKISSDSSIASTVKDTTDAEINSLLELKVAKLEKDMSELKKIDLSAEALAALKTQVPSVVDNYLRSKVRDVFQKELKKHTTYLIHKYSMQQILKFPKKQTPTVDLEQESEKTPSGILKIKREQAEKLKMPKFTIKSTNKAALHEYDLKIANIVQDHKRKHDDNEDDDDEDPPAGPNQGKAPSKGFKTGKSASANEPVKEPIAEVVMDDAGDDVQPSRPPTPDPEWNKCQVILDQPEQPWFNEMVSAIEDPLTCNDLMATPIDFSNTVSSSVKLRVPLSRVFNPLTTS
ncbi:hypothetical protein Tco_1048900 [Tanacetum coccineum]